MWSLLALTCLGLLTHGVRGMSDCYNPKTGHPEVCLPPFVNAASGKVVQATNTCGTSGQPEEYCLQTGATGVNKSCHYCYAPDPRRSHNAVYLTDISRESRPTWWQSETMLGDVQYPSMVNLTLDLGKAFDITYVRLKFRSSRPESFAIYKKTSRTSEWEAYQFYSGTCHRTYSLDNKEFITTDDEKKALCTEDYSDISPLTGGNVAFSTLEGRPSAYNFDKSKVLQEWVTAVSIRITLNRINTFGDEVFSDSKVLKSYYYAISDFAVGGRCKCNGHASECHLSDEGKMVCECEHNTQGDDCELCADLHNDAPWQRGGDGDAHECKLCDCNGLADKCEFDPELYRATGHGGRCIGCRDNTAGVHCELCLPYYYRDPITDRCVSCDCSVTGSVSKQCSADGKCTCKPGVGGDRCDQCLPGFYGLTEAGCTTCQCSAYGTEAGTVCDPVTGDCKCKLNVEGTQCDRCKPGTMNLQYDNPYGCTACFCYGHSSICEVAGGYTVIQIKSDFRTGDDNWKTIELHTGKQVPVTWSGDGKVGQTGAYFSAPAKFLGEQRFSYNQFLEVVLSAEVADPFFLSSDEGSGSDEVLGLESSPYDLIIEGDQYRVSLPLTGQNHPAPSSEPQMYRYRLHEAAGFAPKLSAFQFQKMLNDIKSIRIRAVEGAVSTYLHSVSMDSAELGGTGPPADWIEYCQVSGYLDGFAGSCAPGYTREAANGGKYSPCVPCDCNGHGNNCDPDTGICECLDNTAGDHCEICLVGFYKKPDDDRCVPCPCPNNIACAITDDGQVKCLSCPPGHIGNQCEFCMDGWFGDPRGLGQCQRCTCNGNIDMNAIMNCDRVTGECLKCTHNTTGARCERCLDGYYGQPVTDNPAERCRACECYSLGSHSAVQCDRVTGQCSCLPFVTGKHCEQCQDGYWGIQSGEGCTSCACHSLGATTGKCDQDSGQCDCQPGVTGQHCDRCSPNYYQLTREGCSACECSQVGSKTLQCNEDGRCDCKEGVLGLKCDQCQENYYDIASGCIECPPCYGLVQDAVNEHRDELSRLEDMAANIDNKPVTGGDNFTKKLGGLKNTLSDLQKQADDLSSKREVLDDQMSGIHDSIEKLVMQLAAIENNVDSCAERVDGANSTTAKSSLSKDEIDQTLERAQDQLDKAMQYISQANVIALDSINKEDNMTKLADEADALADQHTQESEAIVSTAQNALDTSRNAWKAMQDAITTISTLINSFDDMTEDRLPNAIALRDQLAKISHDVLAKTEESKNNATYLLTEANKLLQSMPSYNTDELDLEAQKIIEKAHNLLPSIEDLETEYMQDDGSIDNDIKRADIMLDSAEAVQDSTDMLTAQAHSARETALEAAKKGNTTYQLLLDIEKSLQDFDGQISDNRGRAEAAMGTADEIQSTIDAANNKTRQAKEALGSARSTAELTSGKAKNAQNLAESVQESATAIRVDAENYFDEVTDVLNKVQSLAEDVTSTGKNLSRADDQTRHNQNEVSGATAEAGNAKSKANTARQRVNAVLLSLQTLKERLESIPDIDETEIMRYENELARIKEQVKNADLESTISKLQSAVDEQLESMASYDRDIDMLNDDIRNLQQINATLPTECYKDVPAVELP